MSADAPASCSSGRTLQRPQSGRGNPMRRPEVTGASIVAEGIERKEELQGLRVLGVHFGRGYLLGRPVSLVDLEAFLDRTPAPS